MTSQYINSMFHKAIEQRAIVLNSKLKVVVQSGFLKCTFLLAILTFFQVEPISAQLTAGSIPFGAMVIEHNVHLVGTNEYVTPTPVYSDSLDLNGDQIHDIEVILQMGIPDQDWPHVLRIKQIDSIYTFCHRTTYPFGLQSDIFKIYNSDSIMSCEPPLVMLPELPLLGTPLYSGKVSETPIAPDQNDPEVDFEYLLFSKNSIDGPEHGWIEISFDLSAILGDSIWATIHRTVLDESPNSILEYNTEEELTISPNPLASDVLTIQSNTHLEEIELYDLLGNQIAVQRRGQYQVQVPFGLSGLYLIRTIDQENRSTFRKVIIHH